MRITRAMLSLMNQENQSKPLENRSKMLKMVSPSRLLEIKLSKLKNKSLEPAKFSKKNWKNQHQLLWSTRRVNLRMPRAMLSLMIQENQLKPLRNRSN